MQSHNGINNNDLNRNLLEDDQKEVMADIAITELDTDDLGYNSLAKKMIEEKVDADPKRAGANRAFRKLKNMKELIEALDGKIANINATIANWIVEYRFNINGMNEVGEQMRRFRGAASEYFFTYSLDTLQDGVRYLLRKPSSVVENYELDTNYLAMQADYDNLENLANQHATNIKRLRAFKDLLKNELTNLKKLQKEHTYDLNSHYTTMYRIYMLNYILMLIDDLAFSVWIFNQSGDTIDEIMDLFQHPYLSSEANNGLTYPFVIADLLYNMTLVNPEMMVNADIYAYHRKFGYASYSESTRQYWSELAQKTRTQSVLTTVYDINNVIAKEAHHSAGALANSAGLNSVAFLKNAGWSKWALFGPMWHLGAQYYRAGYDGAYYNGLKVLPEQLHSLFVTHLWQDVELARTFTVLVQGFAAVVLRAAVFDTIAMSVLDIQPSPFFWAHRQTLEAIVVYGVFWQAMGHRFTRAYKSIYGDKDALTKMFYEQAVKDDLNADQTSKVRSLLERYHLDPAAEDAAVITMLKDMAKIIQKNAYDKIANKLYSVMTFNEKRNLLGGNFLPTALTGATLGVLTGYYSESLINLSNSITDVNMDALGVQVIQAMIGAGGGTLGYIVANTALMKSHMDGLVKRYLTKFEYEQQFASFIVDLVQQGRLEETEKQQIEDTYGLWMETLTAAIVNSIAFTIVVLDLVARTEGGIAPTAKPALGVIDFVPLITMVAFLLIQQNINSFNVFFNDIKDSINTHAERLAAIKEYLSPAKSTVEIEEILDDDIEDPLNNMQNDAIVQDEYTNEDVADIVIKNAQEIEKPSIVSNVIHMFNRNKHQAKPWEKKPDVKAASRTYSPV